MSRTKEVQAIEKKVIDMRGAGCKDCEFKKNFLVFLKGTSMARNEHTAVLRVECKLFPKAPIKPVVLENNGDCRHILRQKLKKASDEVYKPKITQY